MPDKWRGWCHNTGRRNGEKNSKYKKGGLKKLQLLAGVGFQILLSNCGLEICSYCFFGYKTDNTFCLNCMFYQLLRGQHSCSSHSPREVYYHLLFGWDTKIPRVAPFSFWIGNWDLIVHRGQKSYTPTAFGKLWTTQGITCTKHALS